MDSDLATPTATIPISADLEQPIPLTWGDIVRRALGLLMPLAMLAAAAHLTIDIGSLLGWFPICAGLSLAFQFAVVRTRSWLAYLLAGWPSLAIIGCCLTIAHMSWLPHAAQRPIATLWWGAVVLMLVLAIPGNNILWRFHARHPNREPFRWQFPLRLLLLQMFLVSILMFLFRAGEHVLYKIFIYGAGSLFLLSGLAFSLFVANLGRRASTRPSNPWDAPDDTPRDETETK